MERLANAALQAALPSVSHGAAPHTKAQCSTAWPGPLCQEATWPLCSLGCAAGRYARGPCAQRATAVASQPTAICQSRGNPSDVCLSLQRCHQMDIRYFVLTTLHIARERKGNGNMCAPLRARAILLHVSPMPSVALPCAGCLQALAPGTAPLLAWGEELEDIGSRLAGAVVALAEQHTRCLVESQRHLRLYQTVRDAAWPALV